MIDKNKVTLMAKTGFTKTEIAKRLNCSRRQVTRIIKKNNINIHPLSALRDEEAELALRKIFFAFEGGQRAANRFGLSRQAIYNIKEAI